MPILLFALFLIGSLDLARAHMHAGFGEPDPRWKYVRLSTTTALLPIRTVGSDEPWEQVVQDIQVRLGPQVSGRELRVGFYNHGAFVTPTDVQDDVLFVAALGVAARMDVMVFPQWRFPETNPLWDIPRRILQEQLSTPMKNPAETFTEVFRGQLRQLALDNRYATAHAAMRLAAGIRAFHAQGMTPSLAAFSNSALVLVRLGQVLEQGIISDGRETLALAEDVRQGVWVSNIVTFGYPLPNGVVSAALRQRVQGAFVNVVPAPCWKQWAGNFLLRGGAENVTVSWAPFHADWPRLPPKGPEVAVLGALLGGSAAAWRERLMPRPRHEVPGPLQVTKWLQDAVCDQLQVLESSLPPDTP